MPAKILNLILAPDVRRKALNNQVQAISAVPHGQRIRWLGLLLQRLRGAGCLTPNQPQRRFHHDPLVKLRFDAVAGGAAGG